MPLPTTARTAINRACTQASPRRAAGEDVAQYILACPELHPAAIVAKARVTLGEGV
jgi:hypothetical protein